MRNIVYIHIYKKRRTNTRKTNTLGLKKTRRVFPGSVRSENMAQFSRAIFPRLILYSVYVIYYIVCIFFSLEFACSSFASWILFNISIRIWCFQISRAISNFLFGSNTMKNTLAVILKIEITFSVFEKYPTTCLPFPFVSPLFSS